MATNGKRDLSETVGSNLRALREQHGVTQDQIATAAKTVGLPWGRSSISVLEAGRRDVGADELLLLPTVFWVATGGRRRHGVRISLTDLLGDETIALTDVAELTASRLVETLAGEPIQFDVIDSSGRDRLVDGMLNAGVNEAERKMAVRLGVSPNRVTVLAKYRFHQTLVEEREMRLRQRLERNVDDPLTDVEARRVQALRGHVTRELEADLRDEHATLGRPAPEPTNLG